MESLKVVNDESLRLGVLEEERKIAARRSSIEHKITLVRERIQTFSLIEPSTSQYEYQWQRDASQCQRDANELEKELSRFNARNSKILYDGNLFYVSEGVVYRVEYCFQS